jgi:hypothetical protein
MTPAELRQAACRGRVTREHDPWAGETEADVLEAQAVCARCPVRAACEVDAAGEEHGVWAGVLRSPDVSMVVAEPARIRVTVAAVHGNRGTYLHCTAGEGGGKCADCRRANASYIAGYRDHGPVTTRETLEQFEQMTIGA